MPKKLNEAWVLGIHSPSTQQCWQNKLGGFLVTQNPYVLECLELDTIQIAVEGKAEAWQLIHMAKCSGWTFECSNKDTYGGLAMVHR